MKAISLLRITFHAGLCALTLGLAAPAQAVVIYDESVDGDAPSGGVAANVGTLLVGSNEILGATGFGDFDDYTFEVAAGTVLESIRLIHPDIVGYGLRLLDSSMAVLASEGLLGPINQLIFTSVLPLSAGIYIIDNNSISQTVGAPPGDYEYILTVRAVPEPGTLALFGLGLAGLGFARRRKAA